MSDAGNRDRPAGCPAPALDPTVPLLRACRAGTDRREPDFLQSTGAVYPTAWRAGRSSRYGRFSVFHRWPDQDLEVNKALLTAHQLDPSSVFAALDVAAFPCYVTSADGTPFVWGGYRWCLYIEQPDPQQDNHTNVVLAREDLPNATPDTPVPPAVFDRATEHLARLSVLLPNE